MAAANPPQNPPRYPVLKQWLWHCCSLKGQAKQSLVSRGMRVSAFMVSLHLLSLSDLRRRENSSLRISFFMWGLYRCGRNCQRVRMQFQASSLRDQSSESAMTGGTEAALPAGRSEASTPTTRVAARVPSRAR